MVALIGRPSRPHPTPRPSTTRPPWRKRSRLSGSTRSTAFALPPAPEVDSLIPAEELAAETRQAADSAADEEVLEALAEATPTDAEAATADIPIEGNDTKVLANAVTWDIDVETYNSHHRVKWYLDFFLGPGRQRMGIWLDRMQRYEPMIRERLARENMPGDLVYLALIESGFSNTATSRAKAVGMWQFMKGTAKFYDLRVDSWVDERRDPFLATDAAVRHLRDLNARFGSLYLAAAAYNAGSGRVSRGLRRLRDDDAGRSSDAAFFRLYDTRLLRRETKDYVPKLIAAAVIAKEPARYGFSVDSLGAAGLRLDRGADHDRPRRDRPVGGYHRGGHPRAQPAVPPARDAAGGGLGRPPAVGPGTRDGRRLRGAAGRTSG